MMDVVKISELVLERLSTIGYEKNSFISSGQLIFPSKSDDKRISEQELRQLFIEEFKGVYKNYFFSIETPTIYRYSFTNELNEIKVSEKGQSALLDMCVFEKKDVKSEYNRVLNIEFKHKNATEANISKDILKLMHEEENGAFILLLKNTDVGTLKSVFDKFSSSLNTHLLKDGWSNNGITYIEIIILSLEEKRNKNGTPFLIHRKIKKGDNLNDIFSLGNDYGNITHLKKNGWDIKAIFNVKGFDESLRVIE